MTDLPRIVIAGTQSGVGKTSVTLGLIAALARRGLTVASFTRRPLARDLPRPGRGG